MPRLASLLAILTLCLPAVAHAGAELPPGGQVLWGGQGGYSLRGISSFERQSGKHPASAERSPSTEPSSTCARSRK